MVGSHLRQAPLPFMEPLPGPVLCMRTFSFLLQHTDQSPMHHQEKAQLRAVDVVEHMWLVFLCLLCSAALCYPAVAEQTEVCAQCGSPRDEWAWDSCLNGEGKGWNESYSSCSCIVCMSSWVALRAACPTAPLLLLLQSHFSRV